MGSTPTYGLPYQDLDDPPNGPALGADLANAVEDQLEVLAAAVAAAQAAADAAAAVAAEAAGTDWADWTPTFTGGGSAVYGSVGGRWRRAGKKTVLITVQWTVTTAGSGTGFVTWTLPTAPSRAKRWTFVGGNEAATGKPGLYAETFVGGSGTTVDRMRYSGNVNFTGSMLEINQIYQFSGFYEEA